MTRVSYSKARAVHYIARCVCTSQETDYLHHLYHLYDSEGSESEGEEERERRERLVRLHSKLQSVYYTY